MYHHRSISLFFSICFAVLRLGNVFAVTEKSITLGNSAGWAAVRERQNITDMFGLRPFGVLALESLNEKNINNGGADLQLGFNETTSDDGELFTDSTGNYIIQTKSGVENVGRRFAKRGGGAALFTGYIDTALNSGSSREPMVILPKTRDAIFADNSKIGDFSLEFYIYPDKLENGQSIFNWTSTRNSIAGLDIVESILCTAVKDRLGWSFNGFFASPDVDDGENTLNITLQGLSTLAPKTWSHHLLRFNKKEGLLEYLVNGEVEAATYTTVSGSSDSINIFEPRTGAESRMVLGGSFTGVLDEFSIYNNFIESTSLEKYPKSGGKIQTAVLDLGAPLSSLEKVAVSAGRTNLSAGNFQNDYDFDGKLGVLGANSTDAPETLTFFVRAGEDRYNREQFQWIPIAANTALKGITGRYLEIAVDFYPGIGGTMTPYLEKIEIIYIESAPPPPPPNFTALITDSGVNLKWKSPSGIDARNAVSGYLVYYGTESGTYLGDESPIDVGNTLSFKLEDLQNGVLYYFAIASYGKSGPAYPGEFSAEIAARPLKTPTNGLLYGKLY